MVDPAQEVVLPARARKHRGQFRVAEPHRSPRPADDPQQQGEAGLYVDDLESQAGKNADADHVGNDDTVAVNHATGRRAA
jgi:hypothetical protein